MSSQSRSRSRPSKPRRARKDIEPPPATLIIPDLEEDRAEAARPPAPLDATSAHADAPTVADPKPTAKSAPPVAPPLPPVMPEAKFKRLSWIVSLTSVALMAVGLEALTEGHFVRAVLFIAAAMLLFAYPTFVRAADDPETIRRRAHKKRARAYRKRARREGKERKKDQNEVVEEGSPDGESSDD